MMFTKYVIIIFPLGEIKDTKMVSTFFKVQQEFCEGGEKLQGHIEEAAYIRETEIFQQKCYYCIKKDGGGGRGGRQRVSNHTFFLTDTYVCFSFLKKLIQVNIDA